VSGWRTVPANHPVLRSGPEVRVIVKPLARPEAAGLRSCMPEQRVGLIRARSALTGLKACDDFHPQRDPVPQHRGIERVTGTAMSTGAPARAT
jgi:hypothetical protein